MISLLQDLLSSSPCSRWGGGGSLPEAEKQKVLGRTESLKVSSDCLVYGM